MGVEFHAIWRVPQAGQDYFLSMTMFVAKMQPKDWVQFRIKFAIVQASYNFQHNFPAGLSQVQ